MGSATVVGGAKLTEVASGVDEKKTAESVGFAESV